MPDRDTLRVYGASDFAVTADGGDWTAQLVVGLDHTGKVFLLDLWRKQASSDVWVEAMCDLILKWKPMGWATEKGQIASGVGPYLEQRMRERRAYCVREAFPTRGDKAVRAQSIRGYIERHGLYIQKNAPWFATLRAELLAFPAGRNDDIVDALGLVGQLADKMLRGAPLRPLKPATLKDRWDKAFEREHGGPNNWKTA